MTAVDIMKRIRESSDKEVRLSPEESSIIVASGFWGDELRTEGYYSGHRVLLNDHPGE